MIFNLIRKKMLNISKVPSPTITIRDESFHFDITGRNVRNFSTNGPLPHHQSDQKSMSPPLPTVHLVALAKVFLQAYILFQMFDVLLLLFQALGFLPSMYLALSAWIQGGLDSFMIRHPNLALIEWLFSSMVLKPKPPNPNFLGLQTFLHLTKCHPTKNLC